MDYNNSSIDIKDKIVSEQSHATKDVTCGGSLENPAHKLSKKIEKSIFPGLSLSNPTEEDRNFIFRDENDNVMVVDKTPGESRYVWAPVFSMDELVSGEKYLIGKVIPDGDESSIVFNGSLDTLDVDGNVIEVSAGWDPEAVLDVIFYDETNENAYFIIEQIEGDTYSIKSQSGYYIGRTSNSNGLESSRETVYQNTISFDGARITIASSAGPKLMENRSGNRFRFFKSNQDQIRLYKKTEISVPDEYKWKTLVSNDDIDVITEEELDEILIPQCIPGNKIDCEN